MCMHVHIHVYANICIQYVYINKSMYHLHTLHTKHIQTHTYSYTHTHTYICQCCTNFSALSNAPNTHATNLFDSSSSWLITRAQYTSPRISSTKTTLGYRLFPTKQPLILRLFPGGKNLRLQITASTKELCQFFIAASQWLLGCENTRIIPCSNISDFLTPYTRLRHA